MSLDTMKANVRANRAAYFAEQRAREDHPLAQYEARIATAIDAELAKLNRRNWWIFSLGFVLAFVVVRRMLQGGV